MSQNEFLAITRFAPKEVTKVATEVLRPDIEASIAKLNARPRTLRKVRANELGTVISSIRSVELLAKLITVGDHRKAAQHAISNHPKHCRAKQHALQGRHPWLGKDLQEIVEQHLSDLPDPGRDGSAQLVIPWARMQKGTLQADAYRTFLHLIPGGVERYPELLIDILCGLVPMLEWSFLDEPYTPNDTYRTPSTVTKIRDMLPVLHRNHALRMRTNMQSYDRFSVQLAVLAHEYSLPFPFGSVDEVDEDAIAYLLGTSRVKEVIGAGLLDDARRILPYLDRFEARTRGELSYWVNDPEVISQLVAPLMGTRHSFDLFGLLNHVGGLDLHTRMVACSYASYTELRDYLNGLTLNQPEPGEGVEVVRNSLGENGWAISNVVALVHVLGLCAPTATVNEAITYLIDTTEGTIETLLNNGGLVGRAAVTRISDKLGDDRVAWEMLLRLVGDWSGTLDGLISAAKLL